MRCIFLLLFCLSILFSEGQFANKTFYLVDSLELEKIPADDKALLDSLLTVFHKTKNDSVKLSALLETDNINDFILYSKYRRYHLNYVQKFIRGKKKYRFSKKFLYNNYGSTLYGMSYVFSQQNNEDSTLFYARKSIPYFKNTNNQLELALSLSSIGTSLVRLGKVKEGLTYYHQSQTIYQKINRPKGVANVDIMIANVYRNMEEYEKAKEKFLHALSYYEKDNDLLNQAEVWNLLGITYKWSKDTINAIKAYTRSFELSKQANSLFDIASARLNLGIIFQGQKQYEKAAGNYKESLRDFETLNSLDGMVYSLNCLADLYQEMGKPGMALSYAQKAYEVSVKIGYPMSIMNSSQALSTLYKETGNYKEALKFSDLYYEMRDSAQGMETQKAALETQLKFENEKKLQTLREKQLKKELTHKQARERQKLILLSVIFGLVLVIGFSAYLYTRFRLIRKQKNIIEVQKHTVEHKNKEILDSINYAKRLQEAILPPMKMVKEYLPLSFILYKPKDIVAGDFYFMEVLNNKVIFAAADCTGHGVPGAMVSVVCSNALARCVKEFKLNDPGKILDKTRELVLETFSKSESQVRDGMDISLACIDFTTGELLWSGANNPIWIIRKTNPTDLIEIKPDKQPIGSSDYNNPFCTHTLHLQKGDRLYIFTDGFADQFGGDSGKKLKSANFKKLLVELQIHTMEAQHQKINDWFENWRGQYEQIDDVCLMGIEF